MTRSLAFASVAMMAPLAVWQHAHADDVIVSGGTLLVVRHDTESHLWRVEGSRAASCD